MQQQTIQLLINGIPYVVKITPFEFNDKTRFTVSFNDSDDYVFTYDTNVSQYVSIGDDTETIPDDLEAAISEKLLSLDKSR